VQSAEQGGVEPVAEHHACPYQLPDCLGGEVVGVGSQLEVRTRQEPLEHTGGLLGRQVIEVEDQNRLVELGSAAEVHQVDSLSTAGAELDGPVGVHFVEGQIGGAHRILSWLGDVTPSRSRPTRSVVGTGQRQKAWLRYKAG
jgi:hypothetical protein